jgi:sucrose phosphorylase
VLQGVPGIYAHGAVGTCNDHELAKKNNHKRDVNRGVIDSKSIAEGFKHPNSKISLLRRAASKLNLTRTRQRAFHPHGDQQVLMVSPHVFTVLRTSPEGDEHVLTITNVTGSPTQIEIQLSDLNIQVMHWYDLLRDKVWIAEDNKISVTLEPYDVIWLKPKSAMEKIKP